MSQVDDLGFAYGRGHATRNKPSGTPSKAATDDAVAARAKQMRDLGELEQTEVYQEMCAEADERRRTETAKPRHANGNVVSP